MHPKITESHYRMSIVYGMANAAHPNIIRYVGQTTNVKNRLHAHSQSKNGPTTPVQLWISKHGFENIIFYVLEECSDRSELDAAEIKWIHTLGVQTSVGLGGLNCTAGGQGYHAYGYIQSRETKAKLSIKLRGENAPTAILTETEVLAIRESYFKDKILQSDLATAYSVSRSTVAGIVRRRKWKHLPASEAEMEYTGTISSKAILTEDMAREIKLRLPLGETDAELGAGFGVSRVVIYNIRKGVSYKNVVV